MTEAGMLRIDCGPCELRPWRPGDEPSLVRHANDRDIWLSLRLHDDVERVAAEIGYWLGKAFWNRGILTAAVRNISRDSL